MEKKVTRPKGTKKVQSIRQEPKIQTAEGWRRERIPQVKPKTKPRV